MAYVTNNKENDIKRRSVTPCYWLVASPQKNTDVAAPHRKLMSKEPKRSRKKKNESTRIHTIEPNRVYGTVFQKVREKRSFDQSTWMINRAIWGPFAQKKDNRGLNTPDHVLYCEYVWFLKNKRRPHCRCIALRQGLNSWMFNILSFSNTVTCLDEILEIKRYHF